MIFMTSRRHTIPFSFLSPLLDRLFLSFSSFSYFPHSFCSEHLVYSNTGREILESSAMPSEISLIVLLLSKNKSVLPMLGLWFFQWLWNVKMVSVTYKKDKCSNCELFPVGIISLRVRIRTSANRRMHLLRVFPHSCLPYPVFSNLHWQMFPQWLPWKKTVIFLSLLKCFWAWLFLALTASNTFGTNFNLPRNNN